jgi:hypothetical protein
MWLKYTGCIYEKVITNPIFKKNCKKDKRVGEKREGRVTEREMMKVYYMCIWKYNKTAHIVLLIFANKKSVFKK